MSDSGYFAVLTAPILKCRDISDGAKLFYGHITRYTHDDGICWETNQTLAEDLGLSERTVSRYVSELEAAGFILVEFCGVSGKDRHAERRIRTVEPHPFKVSKNGRVRPARKGRSKVAKNGDVNIDKNGEGNIDKGGEASIAENGEGNIAKNGEHYKDEYIESKYTPPISPPRGEAGEETAKTKDRFEAFWVWYRDVFCAADHSRAGSKAKAKKAWDKLKVTDELARKIWLYLEAKRRTEMWRRGIGIPYASSLLNDIERGDIDLTPVQPSSPPPGAPPETDREEAFGQWH